MKTKAQEQPVIEESHTLRDSFAKGAMEGAIAAIGVPEEQIMDEFTAVIADFSYKMADAMLAEKYKNQTRH